MSLSVLVTHPFQFTIKLNSLKQQTFIISVSDGQKSGSSPVVKTFAIQCRGCGFDPWSGSQDPTCLAANNQDIKQSHIIINSIRAFKKMIYIKKNIL